MIVTVAPGTTAPVVSVTIPTIEPYTVCAQVTRVLRAKTITNSNQMRGPFPVDPHTELALADRCSNVRLAWPVTRAIILPPKATSKSSLTDSELSAVYVCEELATTDRDSNATCRKSSPSRFIALRVRQSVDGSIPEMNQSDPPLGGGVAAPGVWWRKYPDAPNGEQ